MILQIKLGQGEYDCYTETTVKVFLINKKGLTADKIQCAHKEHLTKLSNDIGVVVNPHWPGIIMEKKQQPNGVALTPEQRRTHKKIMEENDIISFIKKNYKAKELDLSCVQEIII